MLFSRNCCTEVREGNVEFRKRISIGLFLAFTSFISWITDAFFQELGAGLWVLGSGELLLLLPLLLLLITNTDFMDFRCFLEGIVAQRFGKEM